MALPLIAAGLIGLSEYSRRRGQQAQQQQAAAEAQQREQDAMAQMRAVEGGSVLPLLQSPNQDVVDFGQSLLMKGMERRQARADATAEAFRAPTPAEVRQEAVTQGLANARVRRAALAPMSEQLLAGQQIMSSINQGTGFGDIGGIFGLFKFLDPGSRVTEGEIQLSDQASPYAQRALVLFNNAMGESGLLHTDARAQLAELVQGQIGNIQANMIRTNAQFDEQLGAIMRGAFESGLQRALDIGQVSEFMPGFDIGEFVPSETGRGLIQGAEESSADEDLQNRIVVEQ